MKRSGTLDAWLQPKMGKARNMFGAGADEDESESEDETED